MSNISTATYIKKLVKIIYAKEKQIEEMKREGQKGYPRHTEESIDQHIKTQLQCASTQLREVNVQMNAMENKMVELENGLQEEISKNMQYQEDISICRQENERLNEMVGSLTVELQAYRSKQDNLLKQIEKGKQNQEKLVSQKMNLMLSVQQINTKGEKIGMAKNGLEKQIVRLTNEVKIQQKQIKNHIKEAGELNNKIHMLDKQVESITRKVQQKSAQLLTEKTILKSKNIEVTSLNDLIRRLQIDSAAKSYQIQSLKYQLQTKQGQMKLVSETLKDYQEFAFEISQYIESAYVKHCCHGVMRSSKKIIRQNEKGQNRFQITFKKFGTVQQWMDDIAEKMNKITQVPELGNQTVENISMIVRSFEEKLQICDLTERLEKQKEEMDKHEDQLLDNLQRECEKSYARDRSKIVELDEVKQVLKMTKQVNRELMDEINKKQYVITQCRKLYTNLIGSKTSQQYKVIKQLLNIRNE